MRFIDADVLLEHYKCNDVTGIPEADIELAQTIEAIPVDFIKSEIARIDKMIAETWCGPERKSMLNICRQALSAVISNWDITTGCDWREEYERLL